MARELRKRYSTKTKNQTAISPAAEAYAPSTPVEDEPPFDVDELEPDPDNPPEILPPLAFVQPQALPSHQIVFTDAQRTLVKELATWGVPFKDICRQIVNPNTGKPISTNTLHDHFPDEIADGMAEANMKIAQSAYMMAVGWPAEYNDKGEKIRDEQAPIPQMTKWQTQVKLGWREHVVVEQDNKQTTEKLANALSNLTYEDMLQLREMMARTRIANNG